MVSDAPSSKGDRSPPSTRAKKDGRNNDPDILDITQHPAALNRSSVNFRLRVALTEQFLIRWRA
jgi:hypothetical protein